jgi:CheY-like chemotaxis protein
MKNTNQDNVDAEIIKEVEINVVSRDKDDETALTNILKNEIISLKAANASLQIKLQNLRERFLPNVFLVEDNIDAGIIIKEYLSDNYNVINVGNGVEALNIIRKVGKAGSNIKRIDVIILDVTLPGMNGYDLCRELKKNMKLNIPIIFCTANNTKKDVIRAVSCGADDYIIKPFQEITLLEKTGKWVKVRN